MRYPDHVRRSHSSFGLDGAFHHATPAGYPLPQQRGDLGLVFGVPAAWWRTHNDVTPAIALDPIRQRGQQFVFTDFGPSHSQHIQLYPLYRKAGVSSPAPARGRVHRQLSGRSQVPDFDIRLSQPSLARFGSGSAGPFFGLAGGPSPFTLNLVPGLVFGAASFEGPTPNHFRDLGQSQEQPTNHECEGNC